MVRHVSVLKGKTYGVEYMIFLSQWAVYGVSFTWLCGPSPRRGKYESFFPHARMKDMKFKVLHSVS